RRSRAGTGRDLPGQHGQVQRGLCRVQRGAPRRRTARLATGADAHTQRADEVDETARPRQGLPVRPRRRRRCRPGADRVPGCDGRTRVLRTGGARSRGQAQAEARRLAQGANGSTRPSRALTRLPCRLAFAHPCDEEPVGDPFEPALSALAPGGAEAGTILHLFWIMAIGAVLVWAVVCFIAWHAMRQRAPAAEHKARWLIVVGGAAAPTVVLGALLTYALLLMPPLRAEVPPDALRVRISGEQWWWRIAYESPDGGVVPGANELRLPVGEPVAL